MKRRGFTLVELLVVVVIIAMLAAMVLGAAHVARQSAREHKTRATIARINSIIVDTRESYRTRRLPIDVRDDPACWVDTDGDGQVDKPSRPLMDHARWNARRDLLRIEMPDRFGDFLDPPLCLPTNLVTRARLTYRVQFLAAQRRLASLGLSPDQIANRLASYELSECLYLVVMANGGNQVAWGDDERGDADQDGLREFHDGWGRPILWVRWPAGWTGADEPPMRYGPASKPTLPGLGPRSIIISAGADGIFDVNRGVEPDGSGGWKTYAYKLDGVDNLDPWTLDNNRPSAQIGAPVDATALDGSPADGELSHHDNITNYDPPR